VGKILVIDLGTTYFKISLFDREGRLCDCCQITPPKSNERDGFSEINADRFASAVIDGIGQLHDRGTLADIEAVTFATQTNSFVLLDAEDRPLTPILLWTDRRAAGLETEVRNRSEIPERTRTTGIPEISPQFMVGKLLWLQQQSPEVWQRTKKICLVSDYLTLLLTGRHVTESGAAGLTGLVDIHCGIQGGRWWPEMLSQFQIDERCLPEIVRAGTDLGPIDPLAAQRFGLPSTCRHVVGCLDQYAGAIGAGNVEPGMISETTGTVLATVRCADRFATNLGPAVFQGPGFREGLYWQMAFGEVSANYLHRYRNQHSDRPDFEKLSDLAAQTELGAGGLKLRTDVGSTDSKVAFDGMTSEHNQGHAVRCIMETVAKSLRDQVASLSGRSLPEGIRCAGGAARSDSWLQIKADVLGVAMSTTQCPEPTSLGAAILAETALGGEEVAEVARQWVQQKSTYSPDPQRHQQYLALLSR